MDAQTDFTMPVESTEPSIIDVPLPPDIRERRDERVRAYLEETLGKSDLLESNLGSLNCGLMKIAIDMEERILDSLASGALSSEAMAHVYLGIDTHLKLNRQIDRYAQVAYRNAAERERRTRSSREIQASVEKSGETEIVQSPES